MKKYFIVALASVAALTLASCVKESSSNMTEEKTINNSQELITITARIPEGGFTKVDMNEAAYGGAINLVWHAGDKIIVTDADDETNTQEFTLTDGEGTAEGTFTGKAVTADSYIIVYDSIGDEFEFSEQTQAADATRDHLKYKATLEGVNDYTDFVFSDLGAAALGGTFNSSSVLRVRANLGNLYPADVNAVILKADEAIFAGSYELKVNIATPGEDEGEMDFITVYATMPDEDIVIPDGTGLVAQFQMSDKSYDKYTVYRELGVGVIESGKVNSFNIDCGDNFTEFANKSDDEIGTAANPYLVGDQHQMAAMYNEMEDGKTKYFVLIDDIDMTGVEWQSLNHVEGSDADHVFNKCINFDGKNHTISNLTVGTTAGYPSFAGVAYGVYKDVTFENATIDGGSNVIGVFAGYIGTTSSKNDVPYERTATVSGITVKNSTVTGAAAKKDRCAGGLAGIVNHSDCTIDNCHVLGTTVSQTPTGTYNGCNVAGLVGKLLAATSVTNCTAKADLYNNGSYYTAGFIGQIGSAVEISDCAFLGGTITGTRSNVNSPVAGFVGYIPNIAVSIKDCFVTGAIVDAPNCGRSAGFVGQVGNGSTITSCYVENSSVSGGLNSGGFAGVFYNSNLTKSYVTGTTITAHNDKFIASATNGAAAAGFVAYPQNSTVTDCYVSSTVNVVGGDYDYVGGFYGVLLGGITTSQCYEAANVTGTKSHVGAFIGGIDTLPTSVTKCVAWDVALSFWGDSSLDAGAIAEKVYDNYCGTSGTISSQAQTLGWDETVWDLNGSVPVLK